MNKTTKTKIAGSALIFALLSGCVTGHIDPNDRDTTGAYDGIWVGEVSEPKAARVALPNNWVMHCNWESYEVYFVVDDGRVQLGKLETKTPVSTDGNFRIDYDLGQANQIGGVMPGNGKDTAVYSGNFSGENPRGKLLQLAEGTPSCSADILLRRDDSNS